MENVVITTKAGPLGIRSCLTLLESAVLVNVSEDRLRKDIERKRISPRRECGGRRLYFDWAELVPLAVIYEVDMPADWRKCVWAKWEGTYHSACWEPMACTNLVDLADIVKDIKITLNKYLSVDFREAYNDLAPRISTYARGLANIEENEAILGGTAVFKGTRISVGNVGHMVADGETLDNLLEDYPMLNKDDVEFAHLYFLSHPPIGRPTKGLRLYRDDNNDKPSHR